MNSIVDQDVILDNDTGRGPSEMPPEGMVRFVCVGLWNAGTHMEGFQGAPPKPKRKCIALFELDALRSDGKPFLMSRKWTLSMDKKASMRKELEQWRGASFAEDLAKKFNATKSLPGACGLMNIIHEAWKSDPSKKSAKIASFAPLMKGMEKMKATVTERPEWVDKYIEESEEWKAAHGQSTAFDQAANAAAKKAAEVEDDLPF